METKTKTVELKYAEENGRITGYAATFTREPDSYGDVIAKGAFADSIAAIKAEGRVLPLLWNHDSGDLDSYIGTVDELSEDEHGLLFGASFDATEKAQRARELASDGRLCKFSFSYDVIDQATVELEGGRKANELRKLEIHEVSLVLYPANRDTSIVEVKEAAVDEQPAEKAGRRNSAKDADDLGRIHELCSSIQSIVNGLLEDARADEPREDGADAEAEAKTEERDTANVEEPKAKADVSELLREASELLDKKEV